MSAGTCERCGQSFEDRTYAQVRRFCSDNCRKRACADRHRAPCIECGAPAASGSAWGGNAPKTGLCGSCFEEVLRRRKQMVVELWLEGCHRDEIARCLDLERSTVSKLISELRRAGTKLPYRRPDKVGSPELWKPGESGRRAAA